jgi:hypothetical protein
MMMDTMKLTESLVLIVVAAVGTYVLNGMAGENLQMNLRHGLSMVHHLLPLNFAIKLIRLVHEQ